MKFKPKRVWTDGEIRTRIKFCWFPVKLYPNNRRVNKIGSHIGTYSTRVWLEKVEIRDKLRVIPDGNFGSYYKWKTLSIEPLKSED
jgi:hypothetical protein